MIYLCIKPEVKNNDTTAMTKGIYEGCVGDYMKVTIWCGGFFWCRKLAFFCCWTGFSLASSTGFCSNARFGRKGRAVQT